MHRGFGRGTVLVKIAMALSLLALAGLTTPLTARADSPPATTDVVLAIDQSGSTLQSDPDNDRIDAARQFIDTAALFTDSYPVRVGAVYFGAPKFANSVHVALPLVPASTPGVRDVIQPETVSGTDFSAALCLSWSVVTGQAAAAGCPATTESDLKQPAAGQVRSRSIVLITDGFPAPDGTDLAFDAGETPANCASGSSGHDYMCALKNQWDALTKQTPVKLYVIGIDQSNQWFPRAEPYWKAVTGCRSDAECRVAVRRVADPSQLVSDVLNANGVGVDLCLAQGVADDCDLPASLSEVQFLIRGLSDPTKLRVVDPSGNAVSTGDKASVVERDGVIRWRVLAPASGAWKVDSTDPSAQLSVVKVLVPQRFTMAPVPPAPVPGGAVTFELRPDGPFLVDRSSLLRQSFTLETQRIGTSNAVKTTVRLTQKDPSSDVFTLDPPSPGFMEGDWAASLLLETGGTTLPLANLIFPVHPAQATAVSTTAPPTATALPPASPTSVPSTFTATPVPVPPSPTAVPTPPPPACRLVLQPDGTTVPSHRFAPKLGFPLRFFAPETFSAGLSGPDCPARATDLSLTLTRSGDAVPCPPGGCAWVARSPNQANVSFQPDLGVSKGTPRVSRQAEAVLPDGTTLTARDAVDYDPVALAFLEQSTGVDYWLPVAVILGLLYGVSLLSTYQTVNIPGIRGTEQVRVRDLAVYDGNNRPIVRAGGLVWRGLRPDRAARRLVTFRYLIGGEPVVRVVQGPSTMSRTTSFKQKLDAWRKWLGQLANGSPIADLGRSLVVRRKR